MLRDEDGIVSFVLTKARSDLYEKPLIIFRLLHEKQQASSVGN